MSEYLVSYGAEGFLGRFATAGSLICRRGDRALIRGHRGLELGSILGPAKLEHARFLPDNLLGQIEQVVADCDQLTHDDLLDGERLFEETRRQVEALGLPMQVVDIEALLEPRTVIIHFLRTGSGPLRQLVPKLSLAFQATIEMQDVALGIATEYGDHEKDRKCGTGSGGGCGSGGCGGGSCGSGSCGGGGCGSHEPKPRLDSVIAGDFISELYVRPRRDLVGQAVLPPSAH